MKKLVTQVRDLAQIEAGLDNNFAGVLTYSGDEKLIHKPISFVYSDKNMFFFFAPDDDLYNSIPYDTEAIFTTIKSEKGKNVTGLDFQPVYKFFSVSVKGIIKAVEEQKLIDDIRLKYYEKYSTENNHSDIPSYMSKLVMIDTEEIQASEEIGG